MKTQAANPRYTVETDFKYTLTNSDTEIDTVLDSVADHLDDLGAVDPVIVLDPPSCTFSMSVVVEGLPGSSIENMVGSAMGFFRTAFHACDVATPDWPSVRAALASVIIGGLNVRQQAVEAVATTSALATT